MESYHIILITSAFKRCYGLKQLVQDNKYYAITALAEQSGLRLNFIQAHLETIKQL